MYRRAKATGTPRKRGRKACSRLSLPEPEALRRFPDLVPVLVEVDASVLRARLLARGREQGGDIEERIARASMPAQYPDGVRRIDNSGPLVESTAAFYRMVARLIEEKTDFRQ